MYKFLYGILLFSLVLPMRGMERDTRCNESREQCLCAAALLLGGAVALNYVRGHLGVPPDLDLIPTGCLIMEPADPHLRRCCWGGLAAMFTGLCGLQKDPNHSCCASRVDSCQRSDLCQRWFTRPGQPRPRTRKME